MMDEEEKGKIDRLNDTLNSRTRYRDPLDTRSPVEELDRRAGGPDVAGNWHTTDLDELLKHERRIKKPINPLMKKIFVAALVFFLATIGVAAFVFFGGATFISSKNLNINVVGPTAVKAGETLELEVTISNTNNADLEFANLSIQYPEGSKNPLNSAESLTYTKENLGVIKAGEETVRNVKTVLLGTTEEVKEIKFSVEYKVKGSNATFYKDKIFEITIGETPITLKVDSPPSVTSGDDFVTTVSVTLNSTDILKNVVLKAEYPHGYSVTDSTPKAAVDDKNVWILGDLTPGDKKTVTIRGRLLGESKEERTFRFYAGVSEGDASNPNLKVNIVSLLNTISLERPSVGLKVLFNGVDLPIYLAPAARPISISIQYQNNLPEKLFNPRLELSLTGQALDRRSVGSGEGGLYDTGSSKVIWDLSNNLGKKELSPGEGGQVTASLSSVPVASLPLGSRDIILNLGITGVLVNADGQRSITVNETRTARISSQASLSSKVLRTLGPFSNRGPVPPKVGQETTYTAVFSVGNTQGDLADARVTARLGPSVKWLGASSFTSEDISYDPISNIITWNLGVVSSETGFSSTQREISFQLGLTPTLGQIGIAPILVDNIFFSSRDGSSNIVNANNSPLSTRLPSDPAFIQGDEVVEK